MPRRYATELGYNTSIKDFKDFLNNLSLQLTLKQKNNIFDPMWIMNTLRQKYTMQKTMHASHYHSKHGKNNRLKK